VGEGETRNGARYADCLVTVVMDASGILTVLVQKQAWGRRKRSFLTIVERGDFAVREPDHHETATTNVTSCRMCDRQRKACGDSRVDCIAAGLEYLCPDSAGVFRCRNNHSVRGADGRAFGDCGCITIASRRPQRATREQQSCDWNCSCEYGTARHGS